MGTIAARDCLRVLQLTEQVVAACLLASVQAVELRCAQTGKDTQQLSPSVQKTLVEIREHSGFLNEDRALEQELRHLITRLQQQEMHFYAC